MPLRSMFCCCSNMLYLSVRPISSMMLSKPTVFLFTVYIIYALLKIED